MPTQGPIDRLESWKEIASYLKRDVRTVQRWEKAAGMPIHRLQIEKSGSVYAYRSELDAWWAERQSMLEAHSSEAKRSLSKVWLRLVLVACVVAIGGFLFLRERGANSNKLPNVTSLAVLPLTNLTGDESQEYLSDGMTDALITELAQIPGLRVISRTSTIQYKGTKKSLPQIAHELNVDAIVEGTVTRGNDKIRITAQLIHGPSDTHLWAGSVSGAQNDVLQLQNKVAATITSKIEERLTSGQSKQKVKLSSNGTNDPEAYELYLKGRYQWEKRTAESLSKAKDYYQQAIQKDPNYALAYVGLAEYFLALPDYAHASVGDTNLDAKANALRALKIDESLPQAHAMLATAYDNEWDPAAAREYERALELNPNDARVHVLYGIYFSIRGNQEQASQHLRCALEIDPLDLNASENLAIAYYYSRQYERAIEQLKSLLQLEPNYPPAHATLSEIYRFMGEYTLWLEEWEKSARLSNDAEDLQLVKTVRSEYLKSDHRSATKRLIALREEQSKRIYVDPGSIALDYATLGDKERTFIWLEKAFAEKSPALSFGIKSDPKFDFLRGDPRYTDLLHRMNLS